MKSVRSRMFFGAVFFIFSLPISATFSQDKPLPQHNIIHCTILDMSGAIIKKYAGSRCLFLSDGSLLSGTAKSLSLYDEKMVLKWKKDINTHHQINFSEDKSQFLVMTSSLHPFKGARARFDRFVVLNKNGEELKSFDFFAHQKKLLALAGSQGKLSPFPLNNLFMREHVPEDVKTEFSHANSFYEIGENDLSKKNPAFKKGNYLLNVNFLDLILVLDKDLKKILWHTKQPAAKNGRASLHDVQFTPKGKLLLYSNLSPHSGGEFSSLDEMDPPSGEVTKLYQADPPTKFFSKICGGVQRLSNGNLLFSDSTPLLSGEGRAIEVNSEGKIVWQIDNPHLTAEGKTELYQQVKRMDLGQFLQKNLGP